MARVFPGVVANTGPGTQAWSSLSFLSVAREGKELARCVCYERKWRSVTPGPQFTHCKRGVCLFMCSSQTFTDCGHSSRYGGPGEVPWPFIHPVWMRDAVWGQTVRSASQTRGAQGTMGGQNRPGQCAQDLQGRLTVSKGHGYPLVDINLMSPSFRFTRWDGRFVNVPSALHQGFKYFCGLLRAW
jgi:hypothetical protein